MVRKHKYYSFLFLSSKQLFFGVVEAVHNQTGLDHICAIRDRRLPVFPFQSDLSQKN